MASVGAKSLFGAGEADLPSLSRLFRFSPVSFCFPGLAELSTATSLESCRFKILSLVILRVQLRGRQCREKLLKYMCNPCAL